MKIQLLQVNELFDKDSKAMQYFWKQFKKKESNFCSSIANQHHEDFVSPGGCQNTSKVIHSYLTETKIIIDKM